MCLSRKGCAKLNIWLIWLCLIPVIAFLVAGTICGTFYFINQEKYYECECEIYNITVNECSDNWKVKYDVIVNCEESVPDIDTMNGSSYSWCTSNFKKLREYEERYSIDEKKECLVKFDVTSPDEKNNSDINNYGEISEIKLSFTENIILLSFFIIGIVFTVLYCANCMFFCLYSHTEHNIGYIF